MPSPAVRRATDRGRLLYERKFIVRTWLENDVAFQRSVQTAARALIQSDIKNHGNLRFPYVNYAPGERIRCDWSELCDGARNGDPALVLYTNSIADAVRDAGLRPSSDVSPRDFIFNAWTHEYAWCLGVSQEEGLKDLSWVPAVPTEDQPYQSSPSTWLTLRVELHAWNPQGAMDSARIQITHAYKRLFASQWAEWKATKQANLKRQVECLFHRLNVRMTVDQLAKAIEKDGWSDSTGDGAIQKIEEMEAGSLERVINRYISTLAKRHGLRYAPD